MGKSTGQIIGTVVGGVIGAFVGYPMLGASLGGMLGGAIDPPKGPDIKGPRLNDLSVQSSSYGQVIPRVYGTVALAGNVFWIENNALTEHEKNEEQGGKGGGGGATTTSYWYSSTFALGLCEGPIEGIRRIWVSGKLIYDAGSSDVNTIIASNLAMMSGIGSSPKWTLYYGDDTQTANPRMEATLGVGNVPGYRGLAYIVFEDFDLTNYGNSLMGAQFKVEVIKDGTWSGAGAFAARVNFADLPVQTNYTYTVRYDSERFYVSYLVFDDTYSDLVGVGQKTGVITCPVFPGGAITVVPPYNPNAWYGNSFVQVIQSDEDIVIFVRGKVLPAVTNRVIAYSAQGVLVLDTGELSATQFPNGAAQFIVDRGEIFAISWSGFVFKCTKTVQPVPPMFSISPDTFNCRMFGVSENYVFLVINDGNQITTTVKKLNRTDLSVAETITFSADSRYVSISVVSDSLFYQMSGLGTTLGKWEDGAYSITSLTYTGPIDHGFVSYIRFFVFSDRFAVFFAKQTTTYVDVYTATLAIAGNGAQLADIIEAECTSSGVLSTSDIDVSLIDETVIGYRVTQVAAIRAGLEPLQGAWPFDVIQNGYKIKFIPRGVSSVGTVTKEELGAAAPGDTNVISITESREMDAQLARKAVITFLDASREYDVSEQSAERLNTDAVNIRSIEMPIVLTADEGAQIVERLLYLWWLERRDLSFTLPPTWLHLQPADVVTIQSANATFEARLTSCQYLPDGRIEVEAKYNDAPVYVSTAVGATPPYTGQTLAYGGPTDLWLLDVPCMSSEMDGPGFLTAVNGYTPGWAGATMVRSEDGGESWISTQGFGTPGSVAGNVTTTLGDGRTDIIDTKNAVTFAVRNEIPTSVTFAALAAGSNHFAIGADGRWEIVGALTATDNDDGTVTLSNLVRGRFGTEHNTANHTGTDYVVGLDRALVRWVGMDLGAINLQRMYRGVTKGYSVDSATTQTFAWTGESQRPLSPVYLNGDRDKSTNDWHLTWIPRSRTATEPFSGLSSPVGESTEQYKVEIWSTNHAALLRTISGLTSAACDYTAAQQVTDFGLRQPILYVKVYQWSPSVGWGWPLVTSITRYARDNADFYDDTILALSPVTYYKFDGNSTTVTDSSTNANTGTAASSGITYQQSPLLLATGYSFLCAPGTGAGYIICPRLAAMDDAFTVVFLVKPTSLSATFTILQKGNVTTSGQQGYYCNLTTAGKISFTWYNTQWKTVTTTNAVLQANEMAHIAFNYSGSGTLKFNIYKNGALFESLTLSHAIVNITESVTIAAARNGSTYSNGLTGYIDDWAWFQGSLTANQIKSLYEES